MVCPLLRRAAAAEAPPSLAVESADARAAAFAQMRGKKFGSMR